MSARVLITGGSGFIGGALCKTLCDRGFAVSALLRRPLETLPASCTAIVTDDFSLDGIRAALGGQSFDIIYHLAAYGIAPDARNIQTLLSVNTALPAIMAQIASDSGARIVTAGSSAEYAPPAGKIAIAETGALCTDALYGASKAAGYLAASATAKAAGLTHTHLRLFNVYGAGEAAHRLLPGLTKALSAGRRLAMSDGAQIRDFIHIDDVCDAFLIAGRCDAVGVYNICTGTGHSVADFARGVCAALGADTDWLGLGDIARRPDDIEYLVGNPNLASRDLGFTAKQSLTGGLAISLSGQKKAA